MVRSQWVPAGISDIIVEKREHTGDQVRGVSPQCGEFVVRERSCAAFGAEGNAHTGPFTPHSKAGFGPVALTGDNVPIGGVRRWRGDGDGDGCGWFSHWQLPPSIALSSSMIACDQTVSGVLNEALEHAPLSASRTAWTSLTVQMCRAADRLQGRGVASIVAAAHDAVDSGKNWFQSSIVQGADMLHLLMLRAATHETT